MTEDEAVAEALKLERRVFALEKPAASTNPLFERKGAGRECHASCVLLALGPHIALVTASHAIVSGATYEFGAQDQILPLVGRVRRTSSPAENSDDKDLLDLAVVLIDPRIGEQIDPSGVVQLDELDTQLIPSPDALHLAVGYPYTRQKSHRVFEQNAATIHRMLLTPELHSAYEGTGLNPLANQILRFNKRAMFRGGKPVTSPDPIGMSGGSLWTVFGYPTEEPLTAKLSGILVEWHRGKHRRIIATRAHVALHLLLQLNPELAPWVTSLRFGSAT